VQPANFILQIELLIVGVDKKNFNKIRMKKCSAKFGVKWLPVYPIPYICLCRTNSERGLGKYNLPEKAMKTPMAAVKSSGAEPPAAIKVAPATSSLIPPFEKNVILRNFDKTD
jgi:hypothetical protein